MIRARRFSQLTGRMATRGAIIALCSRSRLRTSSLSARLKPQHINNITIAKGKALAMVAVCNAANPPASNNAAAIHPSETDQKMRCHTGVSSLVPPEVSMSTTNEPESDDVTKKVITSTVASSDETLDNGRYSRNWNNATDVSAATASAIWIMF